MSTYDIDLDEELEACLDAARGLLGASEGVDDLWEASDLANRALFVRPQRADAWLVKGQVMSALGDDASALACIEKSLSLDARCAEAQYWNAAVLSDLERYDDALTAADEALSRTSDDDQWLLEELFYEKAVILEGMGDRDGALTTLESGLEHFPDSLALKAGLEPLRREQIRRSFKVIPGGRAH